MHINELFELYSKEREYQRRVFGEYSASEPLNLASFLVLHREYSRKADQMYVQQWDHELPLWLLSTKEFTQQRSAPVKTYEAIIKNFVLYGACLEAYTVINPMLWRDEELIKPKWSREEI